jgi:cell division protein FtsX
MKMILSVILIASAAFILGEYLPWWSVAVAAFAVSLIISQSPGAAFISGFLGIALLWIAYSSWINHLNESLLSERIASVLPLQGSSILLILLTGLIGGLAGGLSALSASYLVRPKQGRVDYQNYYRNKMR